MNGPSYSFVSRNLGRQNVKQRSLGMEICNLWAQLVAVVKFFTYVIDLPHVLLLSCFEAYSYVLRF